MGAEQGALDPIVNAADHAQEAVDRFRIGDVAAGEQCQRREAQAPLHEHAPAQVDDVATAQARTVQLGFDAHECSPLRSGPAARLTALANARPVIMGGSTFGTSRVNATWMKRNPTRPAMPKKWT